MATSTTPTSAADGGVPGSPALPYRARSSTCCATMSRRTSGSSQAAAVTDQVEVVTST
ncbi:hypothetical protein [Geodermatophilus sabuli]|uniref:hypothetical protein n=1 Tax=Geodermatophilus sabuli TaxID=1564158 RepID=UPI00155847D3|nr:hypothetical protein [Geodermatophilus sabuli]MBB3086307.1 hypothetical protein [Geodermatophilus sabuli]